MVRGLIKDVVIYGVTGALTKSLHFFLVPLYTRHFLRAEYAVVDLITVVVGLLSLVGLLQLESAMGRFYSETTDETQRKNIASTGIVGVLACSTLIVLLVNFFAGPMSSYFFGTTSQAHLFRISSAIIPLTAIYGYLINLIRFNRNPVLYGIVVSIQVVTTLLSILWFVVVAHQGIEGVFYGQIIGLSAPTIFLLVFMARKNLIGMFWDHTIISRLLKFGLPMLPAVLMSGSIVYISRFFMIEYLSLDDIGIFAIAMKIASMMLLVDEAIRMTWTPFLYNQLNQPNHREIFKRIFHYGSAGIFVIIALVWLLLPWLLGFLVTDAYQGVQPIIKILVADFGVRSIVQIIFIGPAITKKTTYNTFVTFFGLMCYTLLMAILTPAIGLVGVAIGSLITSLLILAAAWVITERLYHIGYSIAGFILPLIVLLSVLFYQVFGSGEYHEHGKVNHVDHDRCPVAFRTFFVEGFTFST